jgi:hypothetical protein
MRVRACGSLKAPSLSYVDLGTRDLGTYLDPGDELSRRSMREKTLNLLHTYMTRWRYLPSYVGKGLRNETS